MVFARKNNTFYKHPVILAIETATLCGSVALVADGQCIAEYSSQSRLTHSRRLHTGIDRLMQDAALTWADMDGIAVSVGPGSFTGLRIGMSTAKGLAMAAEKHLLGVPTLDGLASQFSFTTYQICPVLDARKKEVYTAFYRCAENGVPRRISEYMVLDPKKLSKMIKERTILIGDGILCYREIFQSLVGKLALIPPAGIHFPRAACIGRLAIEMWRRKEYLDLASAVPIYIRPSEAEINFPDVK